jgi:hypothetical protein
VEYLHKVNRFHNKKERHLESHSLRCRPQNKLTHGPEDAVKTEETGKADANLTLIETDVPIGPLLATTREPSVDVDPNELGFTPGA